VPFYANGLVGLSAEGVTLRPQTNTKGYPWVDSGPY